MGDSQYTGASNPPEGRFTLEGELYLPPQDEPGTPPGGAFGDGTTSGTTGRIVPPGSGEPVDDKGASAP